MSLATRCPACGTVFRVVQDQLKVSEGWVRCGRCSEVFNAVDGLFDLEPETPPAAEAETAEASAAVHEPNDSDPALATTDAASTSAPAVPEAPAESSPEPEPEPEYPAEVAPWPTVTAHASAGLAPPSQTDEIDSAGDATQSRAARAEAPFEDSAALSGADASDRLDTPQFVRRADRAARWRHPAARATLAVMALLLSATLAGQLAVYFRDALAADWPVAQPWLARACTWLGCRVEAPRRIDSLSVDSSGLTRIADGALYQFSLVLHNRSTAPVRMPAIDFALTDAHGQTTVRRVLHASELGQPAPALPPRGELPLSATLDLGDRPVAGYTVELFYP